MAVPSASHEGQVGPGARWGGDGHEDVLLQSGMTGGVVGGVALPAAPDNPSPGTAEGAQRAAVVVAALAGVGVAVGGPWVPAAGAVREGGERVAQSLVACPSELRVFAFAGLDRDRCLAGVGGDRVPVRVAAPAVADLAQQRGGANHRVGLEEAAEDLTVWVRVERLADLALESLDLLDQHSEGVDESGDDLAAAADLDLAGASARRGS